MFLKKFFLTFIKKKRLKIGSFDVLIIFKKLSKYIKINFFSVKKIIFYKKNSKKIYPKYKTCKK